MARMVVIGGGPAGMMAAIVLAVDHEVHLYERHSNPGRKFLVAGEGGLNITNELDGDALVDVFTPREFMRPIIHAFGSAALRQWLAGIGVPTFVGSSGRVFPQRHLKPHQVLKAIRQAALDKGVMFHQEHMFTGFDPQVRPVMVHAGVRKSIHADHYFFALGGASWPVTGSTGEWLSAFRSIGVPTREFQSSNCGVTIANWAPMLVHEGKPLKNLAVVHAGRRIRGEALITRHGLEGNAIYPIIGSLREELERGGPALIHLDLAPDVDPDRLLQRLLDASAKERGAATDLGRPQLALMKWATSREVFIDPLKLAGAIKALPVPVHALRPLEESISTVGGIMLSGVDTDLRLVDHPHISVMGEMLDFDAPTGGFLLQSAFSTGYVAAGVFGQRAQPGVGRKPLQSDEEQDVPHHRPGASDEG
jgi:uncharacterized flavoprotein (TIGR03862 family)